MRIPCQKDFMRHVKASTARYTRQYILFLLYGINYGINIANIWTESLIADSLFGNSI